MCRIQFVATTLAVFCLAGFCLPSATPAFGQQPQDAAAQLGPLEILKDCIQAAEKRDFQRYIDHLAPDEQRAQAAFALWSTSTMSQSIALGTALEDPKMLLLSRALSEVVKRHTVPVEQRNDEHGNAERALMQLPGAAYDIPLGSQPTPYYVQQPAAYGSPSYAPSSPAAVRKLCLQAAGILDDPRQYLIAVLTEVARPVTISGEQPAGVEPKIDFEGTVKAYQQLKWTLYTRGDYALAVAHVPLADEQPERIGTPGQLPVAPASGVVPLRVEFKRVDGAWKIDRLIQLSPIHPAGGLAVSPFCRTEARIDAPRFDPYASPIAP